MTEREVNIKFTSNEAASDVDGTLASSSADIEDQLVAYKGQAVTAGGSSFDDNDLEGGNGAYAQSCWKKNKRVTLCSAGILVALLVLAVVVSTVAMGASKSREERVDPSRSGALAIVEQTASPTMSPSDSPTGSPTVTPQWDLKYISMIADFGATSENELVVDYEIGIDRAIEAELFANDCKTPITGIAPPRLTIERSPKNNYQEYLKLKYDIDKGGIGRSNIWNAEREQLLLCQVVRLVLLPSDPGSDEPAWVIMEDTRTLDVDFELTASFSMGNLEIELDSGEGPSEEGTTAGVGVEPPP